MSKKSQYGQRMVRGVGAVVVGPAEVVGLSCVSCVESADNLLSPHSHFQKLE